MVIIVGKEAEQMFKIHNFNKINLKHYLIPFLIITLVFLFLGFGSVSLIRKYVYQEREEESLKIANSYSLSLNKAEEALDLTEDILAEKLFYNSKMAILHKDDHQGKLDQLAELLNVDVIYYYNQQAKVIDSSNGEYIGWQAPTGHPVYSFLNSQDQARVGPIRADTESGIYYKYGYHKAEDGTFMQLGIEAKRIQNFNSSFRINNLLEEINKSSESTEISYLNRYFLVQASTNPDLVYQLLSNEKIVNQLEENDYYSTPISGEESSYFYTIVPVNGAKSGYLAIKYSLEQTQKLISYVKRFIFIIFIIIYFFFSYSFYNLYQKNKKLQHSLYYDTVSGLPKKEYLIELLEEKIEEKTKAALFLVDFDNLSLINFTYGYKYGDQFIRTVAEKFKSLENDNCQVFRFSAAKFAIYFEKEIAEETLFKKAEKINHLFDETLLMGELDEEYFRLNIGIEIIDDNYRSSEDIFRNITIALQSAKNSKRFYSFFDSKVKTELKKDKIIEKELKEAIFEADQQKLKLEFQPFYSHKGEQIVGFEALARFKSEAYGLISPEKFIKIAEEKQLIISLTELVLKKAARFSKKLEQNNFSQLKISVNLSVMDLMQDNFSSKVVQIIKENGAKTENFIFEITESIFLENFEITNNKLEALQKEKIKIALDDFGKGYSSFYRFKKLNIDILKIDKDFIQKIDFSQEDELITPSIIEMGHKIGLSVVAEGVETEAQKEFLVNSNCDFMQGYLFSHSLSEDEALKLL